MPVDEVKRFAEVIGYFISKQEPRLEKRSFTKMVI